MPITRLISAATLAVSVLSGLPAAAQTAPTPLETAQAAKLDWVRHIRQAPECRWDSPTMRSVIYSDSDMYDLLAALATNNPRLQIDLPTTEFHPCGSEQDNRASWTSAGTYWQWLTRLKLMVIYNGEAGWTHDLAEIPVSVVTGLDPVREKVEQELIGQFGRQAMEQEVNALTQEVQTVMALACAGRSEIRSGGTSRACPELPAEILAERPEALVRLTVAETLGRVLIDELAKEQRREYGERYQVQYDMFGSSDCDSSKFSYFPQAPDTVVDEYGMLNVALHQYGSIVGRARIRSLDSGLLQLSHSDGGMIEAELDEFEDLPYFSQCFDR